MQKPKIKICGLTNEKDVVKLADYDIYALGFIITDKDIPSRIDLDSATQIINDLPSHIQAVVGVGKLPVDKVIEICRKTKTNIVQLQKGGSFADIKKIRQTLPKLKIWKAVFTDSEPDLDEIKSFEKLSDAILIHSKEEQWSTGLKIAEVLKKPLVLAGGLNLSNIEKAVQLFNPWCVDLIRGVETTPGKKDYAKVETLVRLVRN